VLSHLSVSLSAAFGRSKIFGFRQALLFRDDLRLNRSELSCVIVLKSSNVEAE
jgi:hypothetical protein